MFSRFVVVTSLVLIPFSAGQAQRPAPLSRQTTELVVKVTYEDDRAVADQIRVQLLNGSGIPVTEVFTRGEGEARFQNIEPGTYRLRASSPDIEEKMSDSSFVINPRELMHMEFFQVKKKSGAQTSTQGSVSAAALNVPQKAASEFDKGVDALKKQNYDEAQKRFSHAVEVYPRYAAAINNLGVIAMNQGRLDDGQTYFEQALKADDQYAPPYLNLAKSRMSHKKYDEAQQLLTKATSIDPSNVEVLALLTVLNYEKNEMPDALANARKVLNLPAHERFAFAHFIAGKVLESQNQPQEALVEYRMFLKEAPESPTSVKARAAIDTIEKQKR